MSLSSEQITSLKKRFGERLVAQPIGQRTFIFEALKRADWEQFQSAAIKDSSKLPVKSREFTLRSFRVAISADGTETDDSAVLEAAIEKFPGICDNVIEKLRSFSEPDEEAFLL